MTIEEIQAELNKMSAALSDAGWVMPNAQLVIPANGQIRVYLDGSGGNYTFQRGDTPAECIAKAWAYIKTLPDPEQAILTTYSRKLADAIDYGHENNVPAKLVDPVRRAQKAVSDALLPAPSAA